MHALQNELLEITVDPKGAELKTLRLLTNGIDYLWSGDPQFWGKTSPVLFPIVGALKGNRYEYNGHSYALNRHGFARDRQFQLERSAADELVFSLHADDASLLVYPFQFRFEVRYRLQESSLHVTYRVHNTGAEPMPFSVGGHPAFRLPLAEGTVYEDYLLEFAERETAGRWPISKDGLIEAAPEPLLQNTNRLPLSKSLFARDAVVLKNLRSRRLTLRSDKTPHGLHFHYPGFPYLGLWAAPGADFLCIEPWCGIADGVDASGMWPDKEGLEMQAPGGYFERTWTVELF